MFSPYFVFVEQHLDLADRSDGHLLVGSHLVLSGVDQVGEITERSFILSLQRQAVVQAAAPGAHHEHQLLIGILKKHTRLLKCKKRCRWNKKHRLRFTCNFSSSWLEVCSDLSPSALLLSSVTFCSSSLRLSSTSDNVCKIHKTLKSYCPLFLSFFISRSECTSNCLDAGLSVVPTIFCSK